MHQASAGCFQAGEALQPTSTATTVRVRDGQTITTDGPFAETKEALGGFYLIEAADLDEAIELAARIPGASVRLDRGPPDLGRSPTRRRRRPRPVDRSRTATPDAVVDRLFREESGRAVATLIRVLGDFDLAEEAVQEAFVVALETLAGATASRPTRAPGSRRPRATGPSTGCAARKRLAEKSRAARRARPPIEADRPSPDAGCEAEDDVSPIADDRLRLIFTCCHPALALEAQVALTLRTLGGLTTPEIARAFLVPEPTLAQRLVRAKRRSATPASRIASRRDHVLPERLDAVLRGPLPRLQRGLRRVDRATP